MATADEVLRGFYTKKASGRTGIPSPADYYKGQLLAEAGNAQNKRRNELDRANLATAQQAVEAQRAFNNQSLADAELNRQAQEKAQQMQTLTNLGGTALTAYGLSDSHVIGDTIKSGVNQAVPSVAKYIGIDTMPTASLTPSALSAATNAGAVNAGIGTATGTGSIATTPSAYASQGLGTGAKIISDPALMAGAESATAELAPASSYVMGGGEGATGAAIGEATGTGAAAIADTPGVGSMDSFGSYLPAAISAYNIATNKGQPVDYGIIGAKAAQKIAPYAANAAASMGSAAGSSAATLAGGIGGAISNYAAPAYLAREGLSSVLSNQSSPWAYEQGNLMKEPTFEGLIGAAGKRLADHFNVSEGDKARMERAAGVMDPVGSLLTGRMENIKDATQSVLTGGLSSLVDSEMSTGETIANIATGGLFGAVFCFALDTPMQMADGSEQAVQSIDVMDEMLEGGCVTAIGKALSENIYSYNGILVEGHHAVFSDGEWKRVQDCPDAKFHGSGIVYPVVNEHHLIIVDGIVFADMVETPLGWDVSDRERIDWLNLQSKRNELLKERYENSSVSETEALRNDVQVMG